MKENTFETLLSEYYSALNEYLRNKSAEEVALDDLATCSPWPKRLLGIDHFKIHHKNEKEILREYNQEKWKEKLDFYKTTEPQWKSFNHFRDHFSSDKEPRYVGGKYLLLTEADYNYLQALLLFYLLRGQNSETIIELGAGFGAMILDMATRKEFEGVKFKAGDISDNAVDLLSLLSNKFGLQVESQGFNYLDAKDYSIIDEGSVLYTCHSLMYLPTIKPYVIDNIIKAKPKLVINIEPIFPIDSESVTNLLVKKYFILNDYNRNLIQVLKDFEIKKKIKILFETDPILGNNPFIPFSVIVWEPTSWK